MGDRWWALWVGTLAVSLALPACAAAAGDAAAGRGKARQCAVRHGIDGVAKRPDVHHIGGESDQYLTRQLEAFRAGERHHEQMSIIAAALSDQDIADLVAWYSSLRFEIRMPE